MSVAASVIRTRTLSTFASSARSRWSSSSVSSCLASLSGAIRRGFLRLLEPSSTAPGRRATAQRLSPRDLSHRLQRVDLADGLVRPKARDPRETHRVAALACRSELAVEDPDQRLARRLDPLTLGEYHRRRDRQGAEDFLALVERGVKEGAPVALEDVERDEGRWELGAKLVRDVLPAQAGLKVGERHRLSLGEREHLAVDHVCAGNREEGRHQLRVTVGNAVERARVELDAVTGFVHLRADAVVLVLDDVWRRKALLDLVELQDRRCEHHPDRKEVRERRLRERAVLRAQRDLSDISSRHVRSSDRLSLAPECARDGLLEESLA